MDADAAAAEAMIIDQLKGKTYTQVLRLAEQAALTVDPALAERRREHAQRKNARVSLFREQAGTAALSGRDLPPDEALAAMASVSARAEEYKESGAFGDTPMDVLRAHGYLDLINGVPAAERIAAAERQDDDADAAQSLARAQAQAAARAAAEARTGNGAPLDPEADPDPDPEPDPEADGGEDGSGGADPDDCSCTECDGSCLVGDYDLDLDDDEHSDDDDPEDDGPDGGPDPGGLLDPALARELAAAAAASPRTDVCVTVTSAEGYAIGHGCARPARTPRTTRPAAPLITLPARLNLTIPASALPNFAGPASRAGPGTHARPWAFAPGGKRAGAPGDFGTWTLTLPGGRELTVRLDPVPTLSCDHRYESHAYQPSDKLRHLVQIRDGTCTFPPCNRHARDSDFEHGVPYDQGGKTCACNAGARSRACHRVKQSRGWSVTQPKPGWHRWQTPAGRVYTQEPKRYPA